MENDLSTLDERLKDLLNSDFYLEKVLKHLLDEGRYDCRLVCRRWHDICSRLPVNLVNVPVKKLPIIIDRFPNAVSLYMYPFIEWDDETEEAVQSLLQMRSLERLWLHGVFNRMTDEDVLPFCNSLGEVLQSCHELQLLSIVPLSNVEAGMCLYSHLSHLTGLTRLRLDGGWEQLVDDPNTDLRNLEDLGIQSVCLESGQLVFPSLTHLTSLSMYFDVDPVQNFRGGALQMILPYASSLQSLQIYGSHCWVALNTGWTLLGEFKQLLAVEFIMLDFDTSPDFFASLNSLSLSHLGFYSCRFSTDFSDELATVQSLTSLKSLLFESMSGDLHKLFLMMPQLTRLRVDSLDDIEVLTVLTALENLEFSSEDQAIYNMSDVFCCMPKLESLNMTGGDGVFQSSCLSPLKELRSFSLDSFSLDEDFFHNLAQLSGLTNLALSHCDLESVQWSEINALTNLESLELWYLSQAAGSLSALLEGKLLKLGSLSMDEDPGDESDQWRRLYRNLPNLRQCFIMDPVTKRTVSPDGFI